MSDDEGPGDIPAEAEEPAPPAPPPAAAGEAAVTDAAAPPPSAGAESGRWDGRAAKLPRPSEASSGDGDVKDATDAQEESLDYTSQTSDMRLDFPAVGRVRDVAGAIHHHYYGGRRDKRSPGRIPVRDLQHASLFHVTTTSDAGLRELAQEQRVVYCRGAPDTGRSHSVTVALDRLTGYSRETSKVIVLDGTTGLASVLAQLEAGCGHLLDGSGMPWTETISPAQLNQARAGLRGSGYLVILVDPDSAASLSGPVIDHVPPDLAKVAPFHLAAELTGDTPQDREALSEARTRAREIIEDACRADKAARDWLEEITSAATSGPAEAVLFASAVWDWHKRMSRDPGAVPHVAEFRRRRRYEQAARLLRRHDGRESPLRQSYAISAAVLDGLALNEVIDGAGKLAGMLAEVEHPGEPGQRQVFAQPLARWLRHAELTAPEPESGDKGGTVVKMPGRELARTVIELAWQEYDAARTPVLSWLKALCEQHRDHKVRIRAVQALAFLAAHDYALVKERVLDAWSSRGSRPVEHLAAAWLLEALVLDGALTDKVRDLLRRWSRSSDRSKRAVAVRAYGTAIAREMPKDAIAGIRISAVLSGLGSLPELALYEMYLLRQTREVTEELTVWMQSLPEMRERAGRVLVRISRLRRIAEGESDGAYDLLWLLAHTPDELGASLAQTAGLWQLACTHESSRSAAWQMLGHWAQSCRDHPGLSDTFAALTDEFDKAASDDELRSRLGVYRRWWNRNLTEETQK